MSSESEKKRTERKRQRELKNARKKELSEATSSSERRQIKAKYSEPKENSNERRSEGNSYDSMSQREAAAGLNLAGNNTMSGRGQPMPTMSEREEAAGLYLAGNDTTVGRDSFYDSDIEPSAPESPSNQVLYPDGDGFSGFGVEGGGGGGGVPDGYEQVSVTICIDGSPTSGTILFKTS